MLNARYLFFLTLFFLLKIHSFGAAFAGNTTPGTTAYPNAGMQLVCESDLRSTSGTLVFGPLDGYVYYLTNGSPGILKKIRLADMAIEKELMLNPGETRFPSGVIDPTSGTLYLATYTDPGIIVRVRLADLTRLSSMTLDGERGIGCSLFDPSDRHIYFGLSTTRIGEIVKIRSSDFLRMQTMPLDAGEIPICSVLDQTAGFAYFGVGAFPGKVVKIRLSDFTRVGTLTLPQLTSRFNCATIDPAGGYAYFAMDNYSGCALITRVRLSDFSYAGYLQVPFGSDFVGALIDPSNGYGYFAIRGVYQGFIIKVRLADFTIAGKFSPGDDWTMYTPLLDRENGYMYGVLQNYELFTTHTLAKVAYSHKNTLHASKVTLTQPATVKDIRFYAHAAGGQARLAIYDDNSPRQLLWQSVPSDIETSKTWIVAPPKHNNMLAKLSPGTYWLAWQTDSTADVASYAQGSEWNSGFTMARPYGDFPATINSTDTECNTDMWSMCLTINQAAVREWRLYQ